MRPFLILLLWAAPAAAADPVAPASCRADPPRFGCANHANLARMADPSHLARGVTPPPGPAVPDIAAVARLFEDRVRDLRREGTAQGPARP